MKDHHRDSLVTAIIGLTCGCVIGSGFMGYLQPLSAALTSGEHAADWFSGIGTWIVGIAAAVLTLQQHRSAVQRDRIAADRLEMERKLNEARLQSEAEERAAKAAQEQAVRRNSYRALLARLSMPKVLIQAAGSPRNNSYENAVSIVTKVRDTIPTQPLEHSRWITKECILPKIAAIDSLVISCRSLCEDFLRDGGAVHSRVSLRPYLSATEQTQLSNIFKAATKLDELADELSQNIDP